MVIQGFGLVMSDLGPVFLLYTPLVAIGIATGVHGCCGLEFIGGDGWFYSYRFYIISSGLCGCGYVLVAIFSQGAAMEGNY